MYIHKHTYLCTYRFLVVANGRSAIDREFKDAVFEDVFIFCIMIVIIIRLDTNVVINQILKIR